MLKKVILFLLLICILIININLPVFAAAEDVEDLWGTISVDDHSMGDGLNQCDFVGSRWTHENPTWALDCYKITNSYSNGTNDYVVMKFKGTKVAYYGTADNCNGFVAVSIGDANGKNFGEETKIDTYSATRQDQKLFYESPDLPYGEYTIKLRATGDKVAASTNTYIQVDKFLIYEDVQNFKKAKVIENGLEIELYFDEKIGKIPRDAYRHFKVDVAGMDWPILSANLKAGDASTVILTLPYEIFGRAASITAYYDGKGGISKSSNNEKIKATIFNSVTNKSKYQKSQNFSWVKGAVYVPSNAVNTIEMWEDKFDVNLIDAEFMYAKWMGINTFRVWAPHYLSWNNNRDVVIQNMSIFLGIAEKYDIKVFFAFFDDCWNPNPKHGPQEAPIPGVHNSRWVQNPGNYVRQNYSKYKDSLRAYVQDIVRSFDENEYILFWQPFNEPANNNITRQLLIDSRMWIMETGTKKPISSVGGGFIGDKYSDFATYHVYGGYSNSQGPNSLCTESLNRQSQSVEGLVNYFSKGNSGFIMWELMIGRDNCRFPWGSAEGAKEPSTPFHGLIYPDGHPWSVDDLKAFNGGEEISGLQVEYFSDEDFKDLAKTSYVPTINFNLGNEAGTGSPDASAGIGKDNFSIRWTGSIKPKYTENYTFYLNNDNISKLWVNEELLINKMDGAKSEVSGNINLIAGEQYSIKIEYVHSTGDSSMKLSWQSESQEKDIITYTNLNPETVDFNPVVAAIATEPKVVTTNSNSHKIMIVILTFMIIGILSFVLYKIIRVRKEDK